MTAERRRGYALWLAPLGLFLVAVVVRLVAAAQLPFPTTEPSAYYVNVAGNLLAGEGLVSDGVWSFATTPLVVPKPAFELWLPMSSFVSAASMAILGSTYWAAQVGSAFLGALVAPLTWAVAREAARAQGLDTRRGSAVAIAAGLLAAILAPFVLASVVPDSYTPFLVFMLISALLIPRVLGVRDGEDTAADRPPAFLPGLLLGMSLGAAYLSRQEVVWLGLSLLLMSWCVSRGRRAGGRDALARLWPVVAGGLIVVVPWLLRDWRDLGSPFPGQAIENAFLVRNEDIFAFADRPDLARYLQQGLDVVLTNPILAAWDSLINVISVPAFPVGLVGLAALVGMRRSPALRRPTALMALLISGGLTFVSTALVFPVATLWGTFLHASGPLLAALTVTAALGGDALLARISEVRRWEKPNIIIAPIALVAVAAVLGALQISVFADQSRGAEQRYATLAVAIDEAARRADLETPATIITDHPVWLADATGLTAVALPDEDVASIRRLGGLFDSRWVAVIDDRGQYPEAFLEGEAARCLDRSPIRLVDGEDPAWLFVLAKECPQT